MAADLGAEGNKQGASSKKSAKAEKKPGTASKKKSDRPQSGGSANEPGTAAGKKQKKRAEAEARNASHAKTKDLRKAQQSAERKWEKAEAEVAELQAKLADPAVYDDNDKVKEIVGAHEAAKDRAADLMAQWEAATLALEAARS